MLRVVLCLSASLLLTACGGSSSSEGNDTYPNTYLQFYNASYNSATTTVTLTDSDDEEYSLGSAYFGDSTSVVTLDAATYDVGLSYYDDSGDEISVMDDSVTTKKSQKTILMMAGDYSSPQLLNLSFERDDELDEQFNLYFVNLLGSSQNVDLYLSKSTEDFDDAVLVGTAAQYAHTELATYDLGSYILYVTEAGTRTLLLQSPVYAFSYETDYVLALRDNAGPLKEKIALDLIGNTTTVYTLEDVNANAQFRVYNSLNDYTNANVYLGTTSSTPVMTSLTPDTLTSYLELPHGDYRASLKSENGGLIPNGLLTLNQGQSKTLVYYKDASGNATSLTVTDSQTPQIYDFIFNVVNVIPDFDNVSLYFVAPDKTMETTSYYISSLNDATAVSMTLPANTYSVLLVRRDSNNNKTLLDQTDAVTLEAGASYLLVAEKDPDTETGYKVVLQH
ncbi:DUF4397 domain-containing protein [Rheinheimera marina]|uniref:DUF4397 domain-containing protein n=1 Tax=Rheinheimera marina TaxID=1774958 RepID=A0ABV9JNL5_9GAMM